jgi:predicted dehydrogenase
MTSKVRCAVIGAGSWGTTAHIPAIKAHAQAELVAVQHHDREIAARVARYFEVPRAFTTAEEVLAIEDLDAVVVSSIPTLHYSQAKAALARGCHVLIEKPMTISSAEAEALVELADARGLHFILGATWHYTTHSKEARRIVQSGELGRIRMISILMTNLTEGLYRGQSHAEAVTGADDEQRVEFRPPFIEPAADSYSDPKLAGGGQICCQTSHPGA